MPLWWTITRQSPGEPKAVSLGPRSIRRESDREAPSAPSRDRFRNLPEILGPQLARPAAPIATA